MEINRRHARRNMSKPVARVIATAALIAVLGLVSGCTSIERIRDNPGRYAGKTVMVNGEIERRIRIPFSDMNVYVFSDGESKTLVFSTKAHEQGDRYLLRGEVVAFPAQETSESVDESLEKVSDFLVSNNIIGRERAESAANRLMGAVRRTARELGSLFFLLEE